MIRQSCPGLTRLGESRLRVRTVSSLVTPSHARADLLRGPSFVWLSQARSSAEDTAITPQQVDSPHCNTVLPSQHSRPTTAPIIPLPLPSFSPIDLTDRNPAPLSLLPNTISAPERFS